MAPTRGRDIECGMDPNWNDNQPIYRQLRDRMVALILEGALKEGDPLPSVRAVAADYRLNPLTVLKGYQQLVDERLVEKRRGRGMFVSEGARLLCWQANASASCTRNGRRYSRSSTAWDFPRRSCSRRPPRSPIRLRRRAAAEPKTHELRPCPPSSKRAPVEEIRFARRARPRRFLRRGRPHRRSHRAERRRQDQRAARHSRAHRLRGRAQRAGPRTVRRARRADASRRASSPTSRCCRRGCESIRRSISSPACIRDFAASARSRCSPRRRSPAGAAFANCRRA